MQLIRTLETLKDLDGIFGSFLVNEAGTVVAQDLPSYFGTAAQDVGPRAQRFQEALSMTEGEVAYCILRFGNYKLALRKVKGAVLAIVGSNDINMSALRMAMNLVVRKLSSQNLEAYAPIDDASVLHTPLPLAAHSPAPPSHSPLPQGTYDPSPIAPHVSLQGSPAAPTVDSTSTARDQPSTRAPRRGQPLGAPEAGAGRGKKRAVYFRGKRVQ